MSTSKFIIHTAIEGRIASLTLDLPSPPFDTRSYLHGIAEREVDTSTQLTQVANANLLADAQLRATVEKAKSQSSGEVQKKDDISLPRDTRLSLTFRDVEKVSKGVAAMMAYLQGGKR